MKYECYSCASCGEEMLQKDENEIHSVPVDFGTYLDAAGSVDTRYEMVDLCNLCILKSLEVLLSKFPLEERIRWYEKMSKRRK